ncbi:MAG: 1-deoxy-D-xylulose-5-phosphate reductoisomerase [Acidimicrobiia bacterium]|nr:1-deoxy-D-xylulose-5-phosphate reductoisomerase [Acidimicrobiia bacterium]
MAQRVALAGSTGSIGTQTLEVLAAEPDRFELTALGAGGSDVDTLVEQARRTGAKVVAVADVDAAASVAEALPGCDVRAGGEGLESLAEEADVVVNGVVGFAGLGVTVATLRAGRRLALANKESLIAGGPVVQEARRTPGAVIVPVDSEHCAIHQCLRANDNLERVDRLVLTASGGPFRGRTAEQLASVTVEEALTHPTWSMGPKITVDSSTLMNKGLEVIEAHELFGPPAGPDGAGVPLERIDVVVHPQSIVHSMVTTTDGATIAQLSLPDMRLPIAYALAWPDRSTVAVGAMDWTDALRLDFEPPDRATFRCLDLAYAAGRAGGAAPAWLNAANEVAVAAFLAGRCRWSDIATIIESTLDALEPDPLTTLDAVLAADEHARSVAEAAVRTTEETR